LGDKLALRKSLECFKPVAVRSVKNSAKQEKKVIQVVYEEEE
jgi:hypothetical protein